MKTPRRIRNGSEDHVDSPNPVDHPGCLFAVFAGLFPRLAVLLIWLARPLYVDAVFGGNWLWPVLGVIRSRASTGYANRDRYSCTRTYA